MKLGVAQARLGDAIKCRRRNDAAESARHPIALIVGHDQQNVGAPLGGTTCGGQ